MLGVYQSIVLSNNIDSVDEYFSKYQSEIRKIKTDSDVITLAKSTTAGIGVSGQVKSFIDLVYETERYAAKIKYLQLSVTPTVSRGVLTASGRTRILTLYKEYHTVSQYTKISKAMKNLGYAATGFSIASDTWDAFQGNETAKLKAIKSMYGLVSSEIISALGLGWINILNFVVDMSLNYFLETTLSEYDDLIFRAYDDYMQTNYGNLQIWVDLYKNKDIAGIANND